MRIVIADGYTVNPGDLSWSALEHLGELTIYDRPPSPRPEDYLGEAEAALISKVPITGGVLERCPRLRYIGVTATGYNNVDVAAARRAGVVVTNVPDYGTEAVAEYTMAMLLTLCHGIEAQDASVRRGDWARSPDFCYFAYPQTGLLGKTLGIVGMGRIGQAVARRAAAFGMEVVANTGGRRTLPGVESLSLEALCRRADAVSLHCPLTAETFHLFNQEVLGWMKPGALLLNTARGSLVEENALIEALESGRLGGAALDVVEREPLPEDSPLLRAPRLLITPHSAWLTVECRRRIIETAVDNLAAFLAGQPKNLVSG